MRNLLMERFGKKSAKSDCQGNRTRLGIESLEDRCMLDASALLNVAWGELDSNGAFVAAESKYTVTEGFYEANLAGLVDSAQIGLLDRTARNALIAEVFQNGGTSDYNDFYYTAASNTYFSVTVGGESNVFYLVGDTLRGSLLDDVDYLAHSPGAKWEEVGTRLCRGNGQWMTFSQYTITQMWSDSTTSFDAYGLVKTADGVNYTSVMITCGTSGLIDILEDCNAMGVGYTQYLYINTPSNGVLDWMANPLAGQYGTLQTENARTVAGFSLGGALAQYIACSYNGHTDNLYVFDSPGIARSISENIHGSIGHVEYHVAVGDIVAMAGESYVDSGTVYLYTYDIAADRSGTIFDYLLHKHCDSVVELARENPGAVTIETITAAEYSSPWFYFDDSEYADFIGSYMPYVMARGTTEFSRSNLYNMLPEILASAVDNLGGLTSTADLIEQITNNGIGALQDPVVWSALINAVQEEAISRNFVVKLNETLLGTYDWKLDKINQATLLTDGVLDEGYVELTWGKDANIGFVGYLDYANFGLAGVYATAAKGTSIWSNLSFGDVNMSLDAVPATFADLDGRYDLEGLARLNFANLADINVTKFGADGSMAAGGVAFNRNIGSVSNAGAMSLDNAAKVLTISGSYSFNIYYDGQVRTMTIQNAEIKMYNSSGTIKVTGKTWYDGQEKSIHVTYKTDGTANLTVNGIYYNQYDGTTVWKNAVMIYLKATKEKFTSFNDTLSYSIAAVDKADSVTDGVIFANDADAALAWWNMRQGESFAPSAEYYAEADTNVFGDYALMISLDDIFDDFV